MPNTCHSLERRQTYKRKGLFPHRSRSPSRARPHSAVGDSARVEGIRAGSRISRAESSAKTEHATARDLRPRARYNSVGVCRQPTKGSLHMESLDQTDAASTRPRARSGWRVAERAAWIFGLGALAIWLTVHVAGVVGSRHDLQRFDAQRASQSAQPAHVENAGLLPQPANPDLTLWDVKRVNAGSAATCRIANSPTSDRSGSVARHR